MQDAARVRGLDRFRQSTSDRERRVERQRTGLETLGQSRPLDELEDEGLDPALGGDAVDRADTGMAERRQHARLAVKACDALGIGGEAGRQELERDVAIEAQIPRAMDLAHPAASDEARDLVVLDAVPYGK